MSPREAGVIQAGIVPDIKLADIVRVFSMDTNRLSCRRRLTCRRRETVPSQRNNCYSDIADARAALVDISVKRE